MGRENEGERGREGGSGRKRVKLEKRGKDLTVIGSSHMLRNTHITHTHTRLTYTHASTSMHTWMDTHIHIHAHTHTHAHACTHAHTLIHTET